MSLLLLAPDQNLLLVVVILNARPLVDPLAVCHDEFRSLKELFQLVFFLRAGKYLFNN